MGFLMQQEFFRAFCHTKILALNLGKTGFENVKM